MVSSAFSQHRASVIGGNSGGVGGGATTTSLGSFQENRTKIINQKQPTYTPPTPVYTEPAKPVAQPSFLQNVGNKIFQFKNDKLAKDKVEIDRQSEVYQRKLAEIRSTARPVKEGYKEPGLFGSAVEAIKQGTVELVGSLGASMDMVGQMDRNILLTKTGQKINAKAQKILAENPEWSSDPNEKWGSKKVTRLVAGAVPSLLGAIGAGLSTGGVGLLAFGFGAEAGPIYQEAKERGVPEKDAQKYGVLVGTVNSFLERLLPAKILKEPTKVAVKKVTQSLAKEVLKKAGKFGLKFGENGALEGSAESMQEMWSNVIASNYDSNRKWWDNIFESFVGGFGAGGIAGSAKNDFVPIEDAKPGDKIDPSLISGGETTQVEALPTTNPEEISTTVVETPVVGEKLDGFVPEDSTVKVPVTTDETLSTLVKLDSAITAYKGDQGVTISPSKEVNVSPALSEITALSKLPEVIAKTQAQVATLPKNEDGTITLYRVGTLRPGDNRLVSASTTKESAQAFSEIQSVSKEARPLTAFKVKPEDIKVFIGGTEAEVLVQNPIKAQPAPSAEGVTLKSTDDLIKYLGEGGFRTEEQIAKLRLDIEQNGIKYPIEIVKQEDGSYIINDGNHRLQIAKDLGIKQVPIKEVEGKPKKYSDLTLEEQTKADKLLTDEGIEVTKGAEIVQEKPIVSPPLFTEEKLLPEENVKNEVATIERGGDIEEAKNLVMEAVFSGDLEASKSLYEDLSKKFTLPSYQELEDQVTGYQTQMIDEVQSELGSTEELEADDPTRVLTEIAERMGKHFKAPGALFKITGNTRVYTDSKGNKLQIGGTARDAFDRMIFSTDIDGFGKNINILGEKFDKYFSELSATIKSGAIDGGDYDQFKTEFQKQLDQRPTYSPRSRVTPKAGGKVKGPKASAQAPVNIPSEPSVVEPSVEPESPQEESFLRVQEIAPKQVEAQTDMFGVTGEGSLSPETKARLAQQKIADAMAKLQEKMTQKDDVPGTALESTVETPMETVARGGALGFNPKNLLDPFSPKATETMKEVVKQSEIARNLAEKLGVPIRRGKFNARGALGIYKPNAKVVRIKKGGLQTTFHEVAHYLDDVFKLSGKIGKVEREALMSEYGYTYADQPKKQEMEGFAEYMRFRMTGQTEKIAQWAPNFDKVFNEKLETMPEVKDVIETATRDYSRWASQPATSKILSHLSIGAQRKGSFKDRAIQTMHELQTSVLDDLHPLSEFSELAKKGAGELPATQDPYILARNLRGWVGKAEMFLNKGTFRKEFWKTEGGKTKMDFTGKSYRDIIKPVEEMGALDDFRVYLVSQRIVNDLAPRKIVTGISYSDAKIALEELGAKYPMFEQVAKERREYKDSLMQFAHENGLIGKEALGRIKELNKYHVPFYRVMEETNSKFLGKSKVGGNLSNPIKKIKGSEREIIDPLESDVKDTYAIINASERNNIGVAMAKLAESNFELARLFERVARPMKGIKVDVQEVMEKALEGSDLKSEDLDFLEGSMEDVVTLFRPTQAVGPNMLNVNIGDKQYVYEVDSELFKAIQGLNLEDVGIVMKILSFPASVLRAGATLSPDFSVRNPLRDQFTAYVYSKNGFIPGVDLVKGIFELFSKGDVYSLWKAGGGEHATFVSLDRVDLQKSFKQTLASHGAQALEYVKNPIKLLRALSELGEMGTRLGEMKRALERGNDPVQSAYDARNVTLDFAMIGAKTRAVNAIIAFFNAQVRASANMVYNFKTRPTQTLFKSLLSITLPSILLYIANRDDDRWKEIPQWQKDLFWIVMTDKHIYRIPKPFELGILFGSVPERLMEIMDTKDPLMFDELKKTIINGFTPGFLPTALIPIIENITNYSFFQDRPIVSRGKEGLPPEQQSGPYTTEVSKIIGEALNYSPAKIDNMIQGYGGGIGKYATQGIDSILKGSGVVQTVPEPAKTLDQLPVIKAFMVREPIGSGSESVNRIYNMYSTTNAQMTYVKQLVNGGETEKAKQYMIDHPDTVKAIILTATIDSFSQMNKAVDAVRESKDLTPQEKQKKIQQIGILQTNTAKKVLESLKEKP